MVAFILATLISCRGYDNLSSDHNAKQSTTWDWSGTDIDNPYLANRAVDRNFMTCMRTEIIKPGGPYTTMWWYVDLGGIKSVHSIIIQFKKYEQKYEFRQRGRMAGFSLYLSNTTNREDGILCYKDGPELPLLDFNTICVNYGRYVTYYNERLNGVRYPDGYEHQVYTELCEVVVSGCFMPGVYGQNCSQKCPENCQEQRCYITNGTCLGCTAGWTGDFCNQLCSFGLYGLECNRSCKGHCRNNDSCNHKTGKCDDGCADGWTGIECDKECEYGSYGQNCLYLCSGNCLNNLTCDKVTGTCNSCKAGYIGDFCNRTCSTGFYGKNCSKTCHVNCREDACNNINGDCTKGCEEGFIGHHCTTRCNEGFYGRNCSEKCNNNCINKSCHHVNGACRFGCDPGWVGLTCKQACSFGNFGPNCSETCSNHCREYACNHVNGICDNGCDNGYKLPLCIENCDYGWYGWNCSKECSTNCINRKCHHVQGTCESGCHPGWKGRNCTNICEKGSYGYNCNGTCSDFCKQSNVCENIDGNCTDGCQVGYTGQKCIKVCEKGWYGDNCFERCSDNCVNKTCHHMNGSCTYGCYPGWMSHNCSKICIDGFYGQNCSHTCFHCIHDECYPFDGKCFLGCEDGFTGHKCDQECEEGLFGQNCSEVCSTNCKSRLCNNVNGNCTRGCESGWIGLNCSEECRHGSYGENCMEECSGNCAANATCNRFNGSCSNGCEESFVGENCDKSIGGMKYVTSNSQTDGSGVLGGLLSSCFVLLGIMIFTAIFIIRRKRKAREENSAVLEKTTTDLNSVFEEPAFSGEAHNIHDDIEKDIGRASIALTSQCSTTFDAEHQTKNTISVMDLQQKIKAMSMNGNAYFKDEYSKIQKGELHQCNEGKKAHNVSKNRYITTFPYDHSRVVLNTLNPKENDYINANFIEDVQGKRTYIATQGPKPKTITDFWRMVWQENVTIIVCLTNLKEGKKTKCAQYWPKVNDKLQNGDLFVRNQEEKMYANHTVRKLRIQNVSAKSERDVYMFHYTQWPDHGVPEPSNLVMFHRHVMKMSKTYKGKYTLVHCSAGIGRTGTYIALDALYRRAEETGKIDVQRYLEIMRKDRMNMIQGEEQYKTVYLALLDSFKGKPKSISSETFLQKLQEQSCYMNLGEVANKCPFYTEFQELMSLKREYTDVDYEFGRKNRGANLTPNVLPVDEYMCHVLNSNGERIYYNAVLLQSFTRSDRLICAQYPLPDLTEDFLRLVKAFYAPIIVSLCPLREFPSSAVWFPRNDDNKTVGEFTTKFSECTLMTNFVKTKIVLHSKEGSDVRLTILECTKWKRDNDTIGRRVLIDLIKEAKIEEDTHPSAKILVLSSDGAKRCGQFCVVYNALEQMTMDREVDIFTITRLLQIRRPEFIANLEDYQFCYDAVADYLQNDTVYANS